MTTQEFEVALEKLDRRQKKMRLLQKDDPFEYEVDYNNREIKITSFDYDNQGIIQIPDFVQICGKQLIRDKKLGHIKSITLHLGKMLREAQGCLFGIQCNSVRITGGSDRLEDISNILQTQKVEYVEVDLQSECRPLDIQQMFQYQTVKNIDFKNLNTQMVRDMQSFMFNCSEIEQANIEVLDLSSVENMSYAFYGSGFQVMNLKGLDSVKTLYWQFGLNDKLKAIKLRGKSRALENISRMVSCCDNLITIDIIGLDLSNVKDADEFCQNCESLVNIHGLVNLVNALNTERMFEGCQQLKCLDIRSMNLARSNSIVALASACTQLEQVDIGDLGRTQKRVDYLFNQCKNLKHVNIQRNRQLRGKQSMMLCRQGIAGVVDTTGWFSSCTVQRKMFSHCDNVTDIILDENILIIPGNQALMVNDCCKLKHLEIRGDIELYWLRQKQDAEQAIIQQNSQLETIDILGNLKWRDRKQVKHTVQQAFIYNCNNIKRIRTKDNINAQDLFYDLPYRVDKYYDSEQKLWVHDIHN